MLQTSEQTKMSAYEGLYDELIPKEHFLRRFKELVDFGFIFEELQDKYCFDNGRNAVNPIQMFQYLLLKVIYNLSDRDLVERSRYDLSFKYFLGLRPEDGVINASSLTKFRKLRLKDENLLDLLIQKSVEIALEKGVLKSRSLLVDSTHTHSRYRQKSAETYLQEQANALQKAVLKVDPEMKTIFPPRAEAGLTATMDACGKILTLVEQEAHLMVYPAIVEKVHFLREIYEDNAEHLKLSADEDARTGHKSEKSAFFGYKTHLAMSDDRIITAATITSGEKNDGKELKTLVEKSRAVGMMVETVIGDAAYSGKENLEYAQNDFELVAKLTPGISRGNRKKEEAFDYNKDAGMVVCPAGHQAIRKARQGKKGIGKNQTMTYYFDIEKCQHCPLKQGCYREHAKSKTYSISMKQPCHQAQMAFQETPGFKEKARKRYKIEAKNSELKNRHGYGIATTSGLVGMALQGATTIFVVNIKRILKLLAGSC